MTAGFLLIPVLLLLVGGAFIFARTRVQSDFDAGLEAFQQQIGAVAPKVPSASSVAADPTDDSRSVVDYPSRPMATDQRS